MKELSNLNKLKVAINRKQRTPMSVLSKLNSYWSTKLAFDLYCTLEGKNNKTTVSLLTRFYKRTFGDYSKVIDTSFLPYNNHYTASQYTASWSPNYVDPMEINHDGSITPAPIHKSVNRNQSIWDTYHKMIDRGFEMKDVWDGLE